jgi:hypothetical protein
MSTSWCVIFQSPSCIPARLNHPALAWPSSVLRPISLTPRSMNFRIHYHPLPWYWKFKGNHVGRQRKSVTVHHSLRCPKRFSHVIPLCSSSIITPLLSFSNVWQCQMAKRREPEISVKHGLGTYSTSLIARSFLHHEIRYVRWRIIAKPDGWFRLSGRTFSIRFNCWDSSGVDIRLESREVTQDKGELSIWRSVQSGICCRNALRSSSMIKRATWKQAVFKYANRDKRTYRSITERQIWESRDFREICIFDYHATRL